jgi:hypothetical protein
MRASLDTLRRKLALTALVVGAAGAAGAIATLSAFSSSTTNPDDAFAAGTVYVSDSDAGSALYSASGQGPGSQVQKCIKVTYTGSLDASLRLYSSGVGALGQFIDLVIETGSGNVTFPGCTGFVPDASAVVFNGTLDGFATAHTSYATGLADNPGAATNWVTNDSVVYRFTLTVQAGAPNGSTGSHTFSWEAQNQ